MVAINFSTGEHVNYQGSDAVIVSNNFASHSLTIQLPDGKTVTVDRNDLFGMNKSIKAVCDGIQQHVDDLDEEIEQGNEKIKFNQNLWTTAVKMIRNCKRAINIMFRNLGIKSENEITDVSDREKYKELVENKSSAISTRNRASGDVIWYAHKTESAVLSRHKCLLQQSLAENFA